MFSSDTHPDAAEVLLGLIRSSTVAQRLHRMNSMSATVIGLSRRAIRRADPNLTGREADLRFIELHYGTDLARKVRERLEHGQT
jgi:hypothetical protein